MRRALVAVVAVTIGACGPERPEGRFAVIERDLLFVRTGGPAPAPLTRAFSFDAGHDQWTAGAGTTAEIADGRLLLRGRDRVELVGPADGDIDPDVHHWLTFRATTRDVEGVVVSWRGPGEAFDERRSTSRLTVVPEDDSGATTYSLPLSALRGLRDARDAAEGLEAVRLAFTGPFGSRPEVSLDAIAFVSDFDGGPDASPRPVRLGRAGIYRRGSALHAPGEHALDVRPGPFDRLRLGLAAAGGTAPVVAELSSAEGRLPPLRRTLEPGADWLEVSVDLSPLGGRPSRLVLALSGGDEGAVVLAGSVLRLAPAGDGHPPVVLYVEDTLRADRLTAYGYAFETDPHLASVAAGGLVFERAFAASNWTRPAVSTLLTGLDPPTHGNRTHLARVSDEITTLAEAFARAGYLTVSFVTNYHAGEWSGLAQGFDVAREPPAHGASRETSTLTSALVAGPLEETLRRHADERLLVYVHTLDPHRPYDPPMEDRYPLLRTSSRRPALRGADGEEHARESLDYDAEVRHNDRQLARLDETLARLGLAGDTLLAFVSDHGEAFLEHGQLEHRESLFQEEVHVPWVLRWPGRIPAGTRLAAPVGHVDVAPTLAGLAGVDVPETWQGRNLSAAVLAGREPPRPDTPLLVDTVYDAPRDGLSDEVAVVRGDHKLIAGVREDGTLVPRALFHLGDDPAERVDLLGDPAAAPIIEALTSWGEQAVASGRAASRAGAAEAMDAATFAWMKEMGYLR